jgi:DNA-binding FadR family transcriptional regulator
MEKIVRKRVSDQVFDRLVSMIEGGEFRPADQLPSERDLVARFGVGRPAIREAMQNLEAVGLITISHGERARVTQPTAAGIISQIDHSARHLLSTTPKSLEHLKEVREFFEVGMARQAAERSNRKSVARLKAALDEQRRHLREDPAKFVAADMAFHVSIASMTGNPIFEASSRAMLQWLSRYHSGVLHWKGKETVTLEEHGSILEAIAAHDADRAGENMRAHLRRTRSIYKADALRPSAPIR